MHVKGWSPPQIDPDLLEILAFNQIQAFYALTTSHDPRQAESTSLLPYRFFRLLGFYNHADCGNPQLVEISRRVRDWTCSAIINTANGFFRTICRRRKDEWFWALEWNKFFRVAGMLVRPERDPELLSDLPDLRWISLSATDRMRTEIPLADEDDILFVASDSPSPGTVADQ
jgi:hypothetical protein